MSEKAEFLTYAGGWRAICEKRMTRDGIELYLFKNRLDLEPKQIEVVTGLETTLYPEDASVRSTVFLGAMAGAAQELIDSLWACGLRPTGAQGSAGQLEAVKYHLEDMRHLTKLFTEPKFEVKPTKEGNGG